MYLTHLSLTNFRNFARLDVSVPRGSLLLVGANAQGKTSLLEAIYFLATLTSFHAHHDRQLINFLVGREPLAVTRIVANYNRGENPHRLEVRIIQETNGLNGVQRVHKEVLFDGVKTKLNDIVGHFNAVLFLPQMLRIVEGAPDERRRYLNMALSQAFPHYADALSNYSQALTQRNALLKQLGEQGGDKSQLNFWDEQIASHGAQLISARILMIQEMETIAARIHRELTRGGEVLRLVYQPAFDPLPQPPGQYALPLDAPISRLGFTPDQIRQGFSESLSLLRNEDIARGATSIGPHRDELRILENGVDLGIYGSRGQIRTSMLALKLAEVTWMQGKTGQSPVLLLDEVLAEFDTARRTDFLARLSTTEQVLLTTTDLDLFSKDFLRQSTLWRIHAGRVGPDGG